jgi:hypothetical protein
MWIHAGHLQDIMQLSLSHPLVIFQSFNGSSHLYCDWSNTSSNPRVYVVLYIIHHDIFWMMMLWGPSNFHPPSMSATSKRLQKSNWQIKGYCLFLQLLINHLEQQSFFCWLQRTQFFSSISHRFRDALGYKA